jgi:hypothetical protein
MHFRNVPLAVAFSFQVFDILWNFLASVIAPSVEGAGVAEIMQSTLHERIYCYLNRLQYRAESSRVRTN